MVLRLCVPLTQRLRARNWNFASSGCPFTASIVAKRVWVSTPLMDMSYSVRCWAASGGHGQVQRGEEVRLHFQGTAEPLLQHDELVERWVAGHRAGQIEGF